MLQKKICLLGAFSVGKTSLIKRFVSSLFDEKYLTTLGVKIDKKIITVEEKELMLMIWDLAGEDDYNTLKVNHLRGAAGYILVIDSTRPKSLEVALSVQERAQEALGEVPFVVALNKADLVEEWSLEPEQLKDLENRFVVLRTSAKTGDNVEKLFSELATRMI